MDKNLLQQNENYIISCLLSKCNKLEEYELFEDLFSYPIPRKIFKAINDLHNTKTDISMLTVQEKLSEHKSNVSRTELINIVEVCFNVHTSYEHACNYIKDQYKKRELETLILEVRQKLEDNTKYDDIHTHILEGLSDLTKQDSQVVNLKDEIEKTLIEIDSNKDTEEIGLKTGFNGLDSLITLRKGNYVVLGAKTKCGKTSIALNIATNIAKTKKVLFFSLEMSKQEIKYKVLSSMAQIEYWKLETGKFTEEEGARVGEAIQSWASGNLMLYDKCDSKTTVGSIRNKCKNIKATEGLDFVVIDYLQLISDKGFKSKYEEVSEISRKLKNLAMELDVPILVLSQFARGEKRYSDAIIPPTLHDFKESGSIENDANISLLAYRSDSNDYNKLNIIVAANRIGDTGEVCFTFDRELSTIRETGQILKY